MINCIDAILEISDGRTTYDLLRGPIRLKDWRPAVPDYKGGGVYQDNPMADGRQLVLARFDNIAETMNLAASDSSPNALINQLDNFLALLQKAADYHKTEWQNEPVWIRARARNESNDRYCLIVKGLIPELDGPYRQPFRQVDGRAVMDRLTLGLEHGLWQDVRPGQSACAPLYVRPDLDRQSYQEKVLETVPLALWPLNETSGTVAVNASRGGSGMNGTHSGAVLDNLLFPNGDPTAFYGVSGDYTSIYSTPLSQQYNRRSGSLMAWVRTDSGIIWTSGNIHWIVRLYSDPNNAIGIYKSATDNELVAFWTVNGVNTTCEYIMSSAIPDTNWIPIVFTWEVFDDVDLFMRLYVFGQQRTFTHKIIGSMAGSGFLDPAGTVIGAPNTVAASEGFSADIAYVGIWSRVLSNAEAVELSEYPTVQDDETSCENIVFAANKHYPSQLTHVYVFDASAGWTSNLLEGDPPYNLLPTSPGVGDIAYFGIGVGPSVLYTGFFQSLIFDLSGTDGSDFGGVWEYRNTTAGTWDGIAVTTPFFMMDHTAGLLSEGVTSAHWQDLTNWGTHNLQTTHGGGAPDVGAYWVRFRVTVANVGGTYDPPRQQNRHVYTCNWGHLEIPASSSTGTIPALIRLSVHNQKQSPASDEDNVARLFVGSRTVSRGESFQAYLNFCQTSKQPDGVSAIAGTDTVFTSGLVESPSTEAARYSGGAGASYATIVTLSLGGLIAPQYYGRYRVFARYQALNMGAAGCLLRLGVAATGVTYTEPVYPLAVGIYNVLDFGAVNIVPAGAIHPDERYSSVDLFIQAKETGGSAHTIYFYDLVLIPIDEWAGEFIASDRDDAPIAYDIDSLTALDRSKLVIDSATLPKVPIRAQSRLEGTDDIIAGWRCINKRPAFVNTGRQRLWLFGIASPVGPYAKPSVCYRVQLDLVQRYMAMRGDR